MHMQDKLDAFKRLLIIMDELREQCPWDRKQTMQSLRNLTIEETYELADAVCDKLINRHPHIYGDVEVADEEEVKKNWEQLKLKEGKKSVLSGVPKSLPAMVKAYRMQDKTAQVGFEWEHADQVWEKVEEEIQEFKEVVDKDQGKMEDEFGDIMFSLINYARFKGIDPETALEKVNRKKNGRSPAAILQIIIP